MTPAEMSGTLQELSVEQGMMFAFTFVVLLGFAFLLLFGLPWYVRRREKLEAAREARQEQREADRKKEDRALIEKIAEQSVLSRQAIENNSTVMRNTEEMHREMDEKIDGIQDALEKLVSRMNHWDEKTARLFTEIKKGLDELKGGKQ